MKELNKLIKSLKFAIAGGHSYRIYPHEMKFLLAILIRARNEELEAWAREFGYAPID